MFQPVIKAKYPARQPNPQQSNFGDAFGSLANTILELRQLKTEIINTLNLKIDEIDAKIAEHTKTVQSNTNKAIETVNHVNDVAQEIKAEAIDLIKTRAIQGNPGKDATPVNEDSIVEKLKVHIPQPIDTEKLSNEILGKVPKLDTKKLAKVVLNAIPDNKASLKIIQEQIVIDPMSVIEKIMELAKQGKFKLKKENIDGLDQTMQAFSSQLGKGYLHGGGDTVVAGSNVTIVKNNAGQSVISSTGGGGGSSWTSGSFTPNGVTTVFTLPTIPTSILFLFDNGQLQLTPTDYSLTGATVTFTSAPLSTDKVTYNYL